MRDAPRKANTSMAETAPALTGRVAIVTGGGRGLGRAMVLGLVGAGASVVATAGRELSELEALVAEVGEDRLVPVLADVTKEDDCLRVVQVAVEQFGAVHVLVNNAGRGMRYVSESFLTEPPKFWQVPAATWQLVIDI